MKKERRDVKFDGTRYELCTINIVSGSCRKDRAFASIAGSRQKDRHNRHKHNRGMRSRISPIHKNKAIRNRAEGSSPIHNSRVIRGKAIRSRSRRIRPVKTCRPGNCP